MPSNNASVNYEISNFTDLGALYATGLDFNVSDMGKMAGNDNGNMTEKSLILESIEGFQNNNETQEKWFILINGVQAPDDIGMNQVSDGDEVNFLYALEEGGEPVLAEAKYVVTIKVATELPPEAKDIIETATQAGNFTTLLAAIEAANLTDTLKGEGPFTVFAPTDKAFAALPNGTVEALLNDTEALKSILLYHVAGEKLMAADVVNMTNITTLQGSELPVNVTEEGVFVGDAKIIVQDVEASNGVIHVIDAVLMPPKELPSKWYFFSIPFKAENASVENLLAGVQYNALVYYNGSSGVYEDVSTLEPLKGYWINVPGGVEFNASAQFASVEEASMSAPQSIKLYPGWNAVGSPVKYNLTADSAFITIGDYYSKVMGPWITDEESGSGTYAFVGYNGLSGVLNGNQVGTDIFEVKPYEGYWVYMKQEGTFA